MYGPAFVPSGIFQPAYLITLDKQPKGSDATSSQSNAVFIEESSIDIYKVGQNFSTAPVQTADWVVNVSLAIRSPSSFSKPFLKLSIPELKLESQNLPVSSINTTANDATWVQATWHIPDSIPERWYTHDLGTPKLYNLTIALSSGSSQLASFTTTTGFRTTSGSRTALAMASYSFRESWQVSAAYRAIQRNYKGDANLAVYM
ncbi:hypothetical protein HWV62_2786 [Athelia sp. TMB]|nr:hypothetical protein HWV62_2786 [Athelia sp. TMB]